MKKQKKAPTTHKQRLTYSLDIKANAKRYYLIGLTLQEVAKLVTAPVRTVEKWYITENWKQLKETNPVKQKAKEFFESGKTQKEIAKLLGKSERTINRYIKQLSNENKEKNI